MSQRALRLSIVAVVLGTLLLPALAAYGQATNSSQDQLMGTWVMDLAKSKFDPDPGIGQRTMTFTAKDAGFHCVINTIVSGGFAAGAVVSEYDAALDGKEHNTPDLAVATVTFNRTDANTIQRVGKRNGEQVETYTMKFSNNGKTLTVTVNSKDPQGNLNNSTQVYNKQ